MAPLMSRVRLQSSSPSAFPHISNSKLALLRAEDRIVQHQTKVYSLPSIHPRELSLGKEKCNLCGLHFCSNSQDSWKFLKEEFRQEELPVVLPCGHVLGDKCAEIMLLDLDEAGSQKCWCCGAKFGVPAGSSKKRRGDPFADDEARASFSGFVDDGGKQVSKARLFDAKLSGTAAGTTKRVKWASELVTSITSSPSSHENIPRRDPSNDRKRATDETHPSKSRQDWLPNRQYRIPSRSSRGSHIAGPKSGSCDAMGIERAISRLGVQETDHSSRGTGTGKVAATEATADKLDLLSLADSSRGSGGHDAR